MERQEQPDRGEHHHHQTREQVLLVSEHRALTPEAQHRRGMEKGRGAGAENADSRHRTRQSHLLVHLVVLEEHRQEGQRRDGPRCDDLEPAARRTAPVNEPQQPGRDEHREEQQEITVRERLQQPREAEDDEPPSRAGVEVRVQPEERERHPLRRQHLNMRQLARAIRREPERDARTDAGERRSGQPFAEQIGEEARERVGEEQADVIGGDRAGAEELQRRRDDAEAEEMLGERHRSGHRPHHRRVPPCVGERRGLRVPPQDPDVEDRVAGVVRNPAVQIGRDRPRPEDCERRESQ